MEVDSKKLETAILYLQRITEGKNPVNNMPAEDDAILNNPNVTRCMSFILDILEEVKKNGGFIGRKPHANKDTNKKTYPLEALNQFQYTGDKSISNLIKQFNEYADMNIYQKLSFYPLKKWLLENGFLTEELDTDRNKRTSKPTEKGNDIGIKGELVTNPGGKSYLYVTYGKNAQELIVGNRYEIFGKEQ